MIRYLWIVALLMAGCTTTHQEEKNLEEGLPPEENRFKTEVLVQGLFEPTELDILPDGRIIFTQRRGAVKMYDPKKKALIDYDSIPVHFEFEDGLMGIALDPNFTFNKWVYLYYSPVGEEPKQHLSRFVFTERGLRDEVVVMEVATQRDQCCHTGGSIQFGSDGLLYLSTGDDTSPFASDGFAPIDERPGRSPWDAQKSSANTNDLRGKILRIKPEPDGTYSIPEGNLFEDDDPLTRPEIYVMGCRNPYRISVDRKRGWLFWGDVGPDANDPKEERGPQGHDEFNIAREPGFYGWPLFVANNRAYRDYDFATGISGDRYDPDRPLNKSPNNTGRQELPPTKPPLVYYPYANSAEFPQLKNGSRNAMAGPVYYSEFYPEKTRFPSFFDGRVFFYDWMRGWVFSLAMTEDGQISDWYPFLPGHTFNNMIDMEFGPDGNLYILEYGTGWFTKNDNASVTKIQYIRGNRPPVLNASVSAENGPAPLTVKLDASASIDYDKDDLTFEWEIDDQEFKGATLEYTFEREGVYYPRITVTDSKQNKVTEQFTINVGNSAPVVRIDIRGNQTFFWPGRAINYSVNVKDAEDGKLGEGITEDQVKFDIMYLQAFDQTEELGHRSPVESGEELIQNLDCKSCHQPTSVSIGPSYEQIANRYEDSDQNVNYLINKIISGGGGVWGEHVMAAHPELETADADKLVKYIFSFKEGMRKPLKGVYTITNGTGRYYFGAAYTDQGKNNIRPIEETSSLWLRSLSVSAVEFDLSHEVKIREREGQSPWIDDIYNGSWVAFKEIDLTNIIAVQAHLFRGINGGNISIRVDDKEGKEIGNIPVKASEVRNISVKTELIPTQGIHDIYFLFEDEGEENRLFTITKFDFIPKTDAP